MTARRHRWLALAAAIAWTTACVEPGDGARLPDGWTDRGPIPDHGSGGGGADVGGGGGDVGGGGGDRVAEVCARWNADRAFTEEGAWTGSNAGCVPGDSIAPGPENTLRQVNLYRWLAGRPPVALDAGKSADAQACALMMHANEDLKHEPPQTWACYTAAGADGAKKSNIATTAGVFAVDMYMVDANTPRLGHRRWILSDDIGPIGVGSTDGYSCLHVIPPGGARAGDAPDWVAWPPPGVMPWEAVAPLSWRGPEALDWHVQSDEIDFGAATVTVRRGEEVLPVEAWRLERWYGSLDGLAWRSVGWTIAEGETYDVEITGTAAPIAYTVQVAACEG